MRASGWRRPGQGSSSGPGGRLRLCEVSPRPPGPDVVDGPKGHLVQRREFLDVRTFAEKAPDFTDLSLAEFGLRVPLPFGGLHEADSFRVRPVLAGSHQFQVCDVVVLLVAVFVVHLVPGWDGP